MSFSPLPHIYLTWEETTEPIASFLRYQIYKRISGETTWNKVKVITDKSITFFQDFLVESDIEYQYVVTVVKAADTGEEVESDFPVEVSSVVTIKSAFIHDIRNPEYYVELPARTQSISPEQDKEYVQVWGRQEPTVHIGQTISDKVSITSIRFWPDNRDAWDTLRGLIIRQKDNASTMYLRQQRGIKIACIIDDIQRNDKAGTAYGLSAILKQVHHKETVD